MPLSALFILFDFTIHNPTHPGTEENLVLLDRASSYFIRLESLSQGTLPGNMIREFAGIAKQYVSGLQKHRQQQRPAQSTASGIGSSESQILSSTSASPSSHESPSDLSAGVSPEGSSEAPSSSSAASLVGMQSLELSESSGREHMVSWDYEAPIFAPRYCFWSLDGDSLESGHSGPLKPPVGKSRI